jgi:hypothetical protein
MRSRSLVSLALLVAFACTKVPTKERSKTPDDPQPDAAVQPDPEPWDGSFGEGFDANGVEPYEAGCPDAAPEAGTECRDDYAFARCTFVEDGSTTTCNCYVTPESEGWSCHGDP